MVLVVFINQALHSPPWITLISMRVDKGVNK
jgi:hypothetical protein